MEERETHTQMYTFLDGPTLCNGGFQPEAIFPFEEHLGMSGDMLSCHSWTGGGCYWHLIGRDQDGIEHTMMHRTVSYIKKSYSPKYQ